MQAIPSLDFVPSRSKELGRFSLMLQKSWRNLTTLINNKIGFGDGTLHDNIDGVWLNTVAPVGANTDFTLTHNMGRIPVGYWVMQKDRACDVYTGSVAATSSQITLRASVASAVLRLFVIAILLSLLGLKAEAQTTNVTLQVTDLASQSWNNGTWAVVLQSPPGAVVYGPPFYLTGTTTPVPNQRQSGNLSATGSATMTLTQNSGIVPSLSQWYFTVCPQATASNGCFTQFVTITSTTTVTLSPPGAVVPAGPGALAYNDNEVQSGLGNTYYNLTLTALRVCQAVIGTITCTLWSTVGTGGGGGGGAINQTNGVTNASQLTLNLLNSASFNGLASTFTNTSLGNVQLGFSGTLGDAGLSSAYSGVGACGTHLWANSFTRNTAPSCAQIGFGDLSGVAAKNQLPATTVFTDQVNTYGAFLQDFTAGLIRLPSGTPTVSGQIGYDNSNGRTTFGNGTSNFVHSFFASGAPITGDCVTWTGTLGQQSAVACPGGFSNPMSTLGDMIFENSTPAAASLSGCTLAASTTCYLTSTPNASNIAQAPAWALPGVLIDAQTGTSFTVPSSDSLRLITGNNGAATAWTGPALSNGLTFAFKNLGAGLITFTPPTGTVNGNANQIIPQNWWGIHYTDGSNVFMPVVPTIQAWPSCTAAAIQFTTSTGVISCGLVSLTAGVSGILPFANGGLGTNTNFSAHQFFGNNTGSAAVPSASLIGSSDVSPNEWVAGGGTAQAQTATLSPAVTVLTDGLYVCWKPTAANTGAGPTLAVNGLTATTITKLGNTALVANDIVTLAQACVIYNSSGPRFELQNPQTASGGGGGTPCNTTNLSVQYDNSNAFGCMSNWTYTSSTGLLTGAQLANSNDLLYATRFTDTSPTGTFLHFQNHAATVDVAALDVNGNFKTLTSLQTTNAAPACTSGTSGLLCLGEGTDGTNASGAALIDANSTSHEFTACTNGSSTCGMLVRRQPSPINQTGQTAAITTATLCASAAGACNVAGQYHVHWNFWGSGTACSSVTAGSVTFLLTWTDENVVAHLAVALLMQVQTGAATEAFQTSFPFQTALANESASGDFTFSTNGSVIQYATGYTACTTGTGTYNLRAAVTRLQ